MFHIDGNNIFDSRLLSFVRKLLRLLFR